VREESTSIQLIHQYLKRVRKGSVNLKGHIKGVNSRDMNSTALITILNQCSLGYLSEEDKKNKNKNGVFQNGGVTTNNLVKTI
jgi:hypothetical protein